MSDFEVTPEKAPAARPAGPTAEAKALPGWRRGMPPTAANLLALQRAAGNSAVVQTFAGEEEEAHPITDVVSGGGSPLHDGVREKMESAFGQDFSDVRVHSDSAASSSAESVAATAATVGNHIVFRSGAYNPSSSQGQHLLAHELTHVVQQRQGAVDGTPAAGGIRVSDPSDRFETAAEANASRITAQLSASGDTEAGSQSTGEATVQRAESEEEESEGEE